MFKKSSNKKKSPAAAFLLAAVTVGAVVFYIGFITGSVQGARSVVPEGEGRVVNRGDVSETADEDIDFKQFWEVWNLVKDGYVSQPVSEKNLFYGSLQGMVASLEDPYSIYLTPDQAQEFNEELEGTFFGIGAEIGMRDESVTVISPLADSPAENAGLQAGDRIIAVDEEDTFGMTLNEVVMLIRGELGTQVTLTILRNGAETSQDLTITRGEINLDSVEWEIREDGIAVVSVFMFNEDTTPLFEEAVQEILTRNVEGIVLDVRNNPGGLLSEAINIAGFWIDGKTVVLEKVQDHQRPYSAAGAARLAGTPTVVLVNGGSASGSEILAGALQDHGIATLIGEQTFGKGSVQEFYGFRDESALKLTTAEWLTPNGRSINHTGIEPDVIVEFTEEDFNEERTPQLDAAIGHLTSQ